MIETGFRVAGVEVDKATFDKYQGKMFDTPVGKISMKAVELYGTGAEIRKQEPQLAAACAAILTQIREELGEPKSTSVFADYVSDLKPIYDAASAKRKALKEKYDAALKAAKDDKKAAKTEDAIARAVVRIADVENEYKQGLAQLQEDTVQSVKTVREGLVKSLEGFYMPDGSKVDDNTVKLLRSGLRLTESEINHLLDKNTGNPVMLRLIADYCDQNKIVNDKAKTYAARARSGGQYEMNVFDQVAQGISNAVSADDTTAKVWGAEKGHFDRMMDEAVQGLVDVSIKPESAG